MPIPFPKMHIAASVMNRVLNAMEDKTSPIGLSQPEMAAPPMVADPVIEGQAIDEATATPLAPVAAPDPQTAEDGAVLNTVAGGSPFDGALLS